MEMSGPSNGTDACVGDSRFLSRGSEFSLAHRLGCGELTWAVDGARAECTTDEKRCTDLRSLMANADFDARTRRLWISIGGNDFLACRAHAPAAACVEDAVNAIVRAVHDVLGSKGLTSGDLEVRLLGPYVTPRMGVPTAALAVITERLQAAVPGVRVVKLHDVTLDVLDFDRDGLHLNDRGNRRIAARGRAMA